ncbi:hypothetical protein M8C21_029315, partial [Ambrosia artemisiifolia]
HYNQAPEENLNPSFSKEEGFLLCFLPTLNMGILSQQPDKPSSSFSALSTTRNTKEEGLHLLFLHSNCLITISVCPFEIYTLDDNSEFRVMVPMTHLPPWSLLSFRYITDDHRLHSTCPSLINKKRNLGHDWLRAVTRGSLLASFDQKGLNDFNRMHQFSNLRI